jgi:hypothetical protein
LKRIRIAGAKGEEKTFANHLERQFMEYLRGKGWVKETALPPSRLVVSLQKKGWIEQQRQNNEALYRMTDVGLAAVCLSFAPRADVSVLHDTANERALRPNFRLVEVCRLELALRSE